ncbi:fungal-specific transcription factor domain-containing protein [Armillaria mellea]|nr:fungal-specific transcription factor domain-containing protein [Armillaria mellea]
MPLIRNGRTGPGAPKAKGTRAKSGCYTCRIRRKKCDEARDHNGHCNTCVRLKIQCLGFGDKRPKWLTKNQCDEILTKIKRFLAGGSVLPPEASYLILRDEDLEAVTSPGDSFEAYDAGFAPYEDIILDDFGPGPVELEGIFRSWSRGNLLLPQSPSLTYNASLTPYDLEHFYTPPTLPPFSIMDSESRLTDAQLDRRYSDMVVGMQYQFSDEGTRSEILHSIRSPGRHQASTRLLAFIHERRHSSPLSIALEGEYAQARYSELMAALSDPRSYDDDQAMASLTMISTLLFDGGRGNWQLWLNMVVKHAHILLGASPQLALLRCNRKQAFLIKACIWFDVLASVTTQTEPSFLHVTRELFSPYVSGISDINNPDSDMMTVMGCESRVVWALAEVSALAAWKQQEIDEGRLSIMKLVQRAEPIFQCLNEPFNTFLHPDSRNLCSEVFRMAARVYLLSVVNGDFPDAEDIEKAVREAVQLMASADNAVVRSTVFAFFVCGCLTNDEELKGILYDRLRREGSVGNCAAVLELLEQVCTGPRGKQEPVLWRRALRKGNLLLV